VQVCNLLSVLSYLLHTLLYPLISSVGVGTATSVFPVNLSNNAHEDSIMAHSITVINLFITLSLLVCFFFDSLVRQECPS
jgi:hypothetical protein